MSELYYLASPYSHERRLVRRQRHDAVCLIAAELVSRLGMSIYAPIAHTHAIAEAGDLPYDFSYWKRLDEVMLERCDGIIVATIAGWQQSQGVLSEVRYTLQLGKPIQFFSWARYRKFADDVGSIEVGVNELRQCFVEGALQSAQWREQNGIILP